MHTELYRVRDFGDGFLAVMPRPRAGDWMAEEFAALRSPSSRPPLRRNQAALLEFVPNGPGTEAVLDGFVRVAPV